MLLVRRRRWCSWPASDRPQTELSAGDGPRGRGRLRGPLNGPGLTAVAASGKVIHTDAEWRVDLLTPEQYRVCREKGTEPPYTGEYTDTEDKGVYRCVACGQELFAYIQVPFRDGLARATGCRSTRPSNPSGDRSLGMERTEVMCSRCGATSATSSTTAPSRRDCDIAFSIALKFAKEP